MKKYTDDETKKNIKEDVRTRIVVNSKGMKGLVKAPGWHLGCLAMLYFMTGTAILFKLHIYFMYFSVCAYHIKKSNKITLITAIFSSN